MTDANHELEPNDDDLPFPREPRDGTQSPGAHRDPLTPAERDAAHDAQAAEWEEREKDRFDVDRADALPELDH